MNLGQAFAQAIAPTPLAEALKAGRERDGQAARSEYVHTIVNPVKKSKGYRLHRRTAKGREYLE